MCPVMTSTSSGDGYTEEEERCRSCPVGF
jgi:hypothetical protein